MSRNRGRTSVPNTGIQKRIFGNVQTVNTYRRRVYGFSVVVAYSRIRVPVIGAGHSFGFFIRTKPYYLYALTRKIHPYTVRLQRVSDFNVYNGFLDRVNERLALDYFFPRF